MPNNWRYRALYFTSYAYGKDCGRGRFTLCGGGYTSRYERVCYKNVSAKYVLSSCTGSPCNEVGEERDEWKKKHTCGYRVEWRSRFTLYRRKTHFRCTKNRQFVFSRAVEKSRINCRQSKIPERIFFRTATITPNLMVIINFIGIRWRNHHAKIVTYFWTNTNFYDVR